MVVRKDGSPLNAAFDALVEQELERWKVPGLTVAVVHGSKTDSKAYGLSQFPDKKMTTDSLFATCSTTKAFTVAATSLVIEDSKDTTAPIDWDTPLCSIIRDDFVLADEYATTHTTLEDALSHRSGYPGHFESMRLAPPNETVREAVRKMRYLPLAYQPRTAFDYCNPMFIAVSHALEQKTGEKLASILRRRIWEPIGMHDTSFSIQDIIKDPATHERLVQGYSWLPERETYTPEPAMDYLATTGAGAIVSNVLDYTKWLRTLLSRSAPLSAEGHAVMVQPRSIILPNADDASLSPVLGNHMYALGWFVETYRGEELYWHSGSWPGFGIMVGFMPSRQFGFAMMGNNVDARQAEVMLYTHLIDEVMGVSALEREERARRIEQKRTQAQSARQRSTGSTGDAGDTVTDAKRRLFPSMQYPLPHACPLDAYAGTYFHPAYGNLTFQAKDTGLRAQLDDRVLQTRIELEHASGEFFVAKVYTPGGGGVGSMFCPAEFYLGVDGRVQRLGLALEASVKEEKMWFDRKD